MSEQLTLAVYADELRGHIRIGEIVFADTGNEHLRVWSYVGADLDRTAARDLGNALLAWAAR